MNEMHKRPFARLGSRIRLAREQSKKSLEEVSGAIELDAEKLASIETGENRPSEEILMLLISYLGFEDNDAAKLWELAGYTKGEAGQTDSGDALKQITLTMTMDNRIVYTDMVHVMVNDYGVVMNFMQNPGNGGQPLVVSRVGMSRDHAKSVLEVLRRTLAQSETKFLPAPKNNDKPSNNPKTN